VILNTASIRDFLWESYSIFSDTEFERSVQDLPKDLKIKYFIKHSLDNLLLMRVKRDPGFSLYVKNRVSQDPGLQERIRKIVLYLFGETSQIDYTDTNPLGPKGLIEIVLNAVSNDQDPFEETFQFAQNTGLMENYHADRSERERKSKMQYLQARMEAAENKIDNDLEILAIRRQILDQDTGKYFGSVMSVEDPLFPAAGFTDEIRHGVNAFVFKNIKFKGNFLGTNNLTFSDVSLCEYIFWTLPFQMDLEKVIFGKCSYDLDPDGKPPLDLWKFEADLATVASHEFFSSLECEEKLRLLNGNFPFLITKEIIDELAEFEISLHKILLFKANQLFYASFFEHAARVAEYAFSIEKNGKEKYFDASFIATCYREYEDYKLALKWYEVAEKLTKKLDPHLRTYKGLVERKNCAEMRFYLSGSAAFKKEIYQIIIDSKRLPAPLRNSIEYNIAEACRRTRHFNLEQEHLIESIQLSDANQPKMKEKLARNAEFNNKIDDPSYLTFYKLESNRQEEIYKRRVKNAVFSFQYEDAGRWLDKWILVNPGSGLAQERAALFKHFGQINDAIKYYQKSADSANNSKSEMFSLISIALLKTILEKNVSPQVIENIQEAVKKSSVINKNSDCIEIFQLIVYEVVTWADTQLADQFLMTVADKFQEIQPTTKPFIQIGNAFRRNDLTEDARKWYQKEFDNPNRDISQTFLQNLISVTYFQEGNYRNAIECLKQAIESDPESKDLLTCLAMCHTALMEYDLALIQIKKVKEMDPSDALASRMEKQILIFSTNVISLPRINSEEIRGIFRTGDWLLYSIFKGRDEGEFDIGPVIVQYGKGVEKILYESILLPIRDNIRSDPIFMETDKENIRKSFWVGDKQKKIPSMPGTLKTILGRTKRSIGLGQWKKMISEIRSAKANPLASEFLGLLMETGISKEEFSRIGELCYSLSVERNGAAHSTFYEYNEVMDKRKEIVGIVNEIISIISSKNSLITGAGIPACRPPF